VESASGIVGTMGKMSFQDVSSSDIMRRVSANEVRTLSEKFPKVEAGCLLDGTAPKRLRDVWDTGVGVQSAPKHWIY